jgi:phage shock protein A
MNEEQKWWKQPQGLVAAATILVMVLGFFYVREKIMWEQSARIAAVEKRGEAAIGSVTTRFERLEQAISQLRDQVNFLERKIDHLEFDMKNLKDGLKDGQ